VFDEYHLLINLITGIMPYTTNKFVLVENSQKQDGQPMALRELDLSQQTIRTVSSLATNYNAVSLMVLDSQKQLYWTAGSNGAINSRTSLTSADVPYVKPFDTTTGVSSYYFTKMDRLKAYIPFTSALTFDSEDNLYLPFDFVSLSIQ
jgi:hypothetical protein